MKTLVLCLFLAILAVSTADEFVDDEVSVYWWVCLFVCLVCVSTFLHVLYCILGMHAVAGNMTVC